MSAIKAGDLVMVVRAASCCGAANMVGRVFIAKRVFDNHGTCGQCGRRHNRSTVVESDIPSHSQIWPYACFHPARLIKIDPPALAEDATETHQLTQLGGRHVPNHA